MEGIYVGKIKKSMVNKDSADLFFVDHRQDIRYFGNVIDYDKTAYCLVPSDDIIKTNDELLKLRDEVKCLTEACNGWEAECNDWKARYAKVNNELFQKGLAYGVLEGEYKKEKITGELLFKDRDALKEKVDKLEKKLAAAKSNETYWCDRKEEEEEYHHYWAYAFDRVKKQSAEKGIYIAIVGEDKDCNAGVVVVENKKANELESQVVQMEDANQKLRKRISAADEEIERLKGDNSAKAKAVIRAEYRGDAWMDEHEKLIRKYHELEQRHDAKWSAMTEALKDKGVEVIYMGEQDGKPNIDVNIPAVGDLKKELEDLKSKTVAEVRYEWKPNCFTMIYTKCDGSKQTVGMDLTDDTDEKYTMGAFVCRAFNIPQCKECKNHRYYGKISGHLCHLPDSKCIIPNTFDIFPLTDEEAEGPACDKFEAKE